MAITYPTAMDVLRPGSSVNIQANTDGGVHYATETLAESDTTIRASFQKKGSSSNTLGDFSLGTGYKIDGYTISGSSIKWKVTYFLYLSKDSAPTGAENPTIYIEQIQSGGVTISGADWASGQYTVSNIPQYSGGSDIRVNGCIAKISSEYVSSNNTVSATRQFNVKFKLQSGSSKTISSCFMTLTWANLSKIVKTFKTTDGNITLPNIRLEWSEAVASSFNITKWQGESSTTPTLNNSSSSINTTKDVVVKFYNENTLIDTQTGQINATQSYNASWNWHGTSTALGGSMQFNSGGTYYPDWIASGEPLPNGSYRPPLPTTERLGYKFKEWVAEDGESCGTTGLSKKSFQYNTRVNATWTPLEYRFKYVLTTETAGLASLNPKSIDPFIKTYGTSVALSNIKPEWADSRLLFTGWKGSKSGKIYQVGQTIDDSEFTDKNTVVELTAQWAPNPNTINLIYQCNEGFKNPDKRTYSYNDIATGRIWRISAPEWVDHSFVGWSTVKPDDFDSNKGTYMSEEDIPQNIKSNIIYNLVITKDNPSMYIPWARTDTYYGIWIKTGKKIKLRPSSAEEPRWVDIQSVFYKTENGWKKVTDIWVKTSEGWKHEI